MGVHAEMLPESKIFLLITTKQRSHTSLTILMPAEAYLSNGDFSVPAGWELGLPTGSLCLQSRLLTKALCQGQRKSRLVVVLGPGKAALSRGSALGQGCCCQGAQTALEAPLQFPNTFFSGQTTLFFCNAK